MNNNESYAISENNRPPTRDELIERIKAALEAAPYDLLFAACTLLG